MKFSVFALIAGLCLLAVTAADDVTLNNEEIKDYEYIIQDLAEEVMDIEPAGFYFGIFSIFKKALRTVKGLNCTIKEVLEIKSAAEDFIDNVHACGGELSKKAQKLIDACNDIITTCKAILGINESICGNVVVEDDTTVQTFGVVSGAKNSHKCAVKMLHKLHTLKKQIKHALELIKQIKKVPSDTSACFMNALTKLESYFTQFPANIKDCSKLTG